jgi:pimeloyl-ACP methyl ester carboxylesterase
VALLAPAGFIPPDGVLEGTRFYLINRVLIWLTGSNWFGTKMARHLGLDPDRLDSATRRSLQDGWRKAREMARMGPFYSYSGMGEDVRALVAAGTPITVIVGQQDPLFPAPRLEAALSGMHVRWLPGIGHLPMLQDPARTRRELHAALTASQGGAPA